MAEEEPEAVVRRIDQLLELREQFFRAGGSLEDYQRVTNGGIGLGEDDPMDSSINGGRCQALARTKFEPGMIIEYHAYDYRGRTQGRGLVQLIEWISQADFQFRGRHLLASDEYYEYYAKDKLKEATTVYHVCGTARRQCRSRAPGGEFIHLAKWRLARLRYLAGGGYAKDMAMEMIERQLQDVLARAPPAPVGPAPPVVIPDAPPRVPAQRRPSTGLDDGLLETGEVEQDEVDDRVDELLEAAQRAKVGPGQSRRRGDPEKEKEKAKKTREEEARARKKRTGQSHEPVDLERLRVKRNRTSRGDESPRDDSLLTSVRPQRDAEVSLGSGRGDDRRSVRGEGAVLPAPSSAAPVSESRGEIHSRAGDARKRSRSAVERGVGPLRRSPDPALQGHRRVFDSRRQLGSIAAPRADPGTSLTVNEGRVDRSSEGRAKSPEVESPAAERDQIGNRRRVTEDTRDAIPSEQEQLEEEETGKGPSELCGEVSGDPSSSGEGSESESREETSREGSSEGPTSEGGSCGGDSPKSSQKSWSSSSRWSVSQPGQTSEAGARRLEEADWEEVRVFCYNVWKMETSNKSMSQFASLLVRMVHNCPGVIGDHSKRLLERAISQQGTTQRWRDLLPLPVPDDVVETVKAMTESRETKLKKSGASGGAVRNTYRKLGTDALVYSMVVGLNCLWGGLRSKTREPTLWKDATPAQVMAVDRLKEAALYVIDGKDVDGGSGVPRTPEGDWNDRIDDARISYHGEVMLKAEPLELERVVVSLPPEGFGAVVNILDVCEGKVRDQLSDPHSLILGAQDLPEAIPKPRVRVLDGEWEPLARSLVERGILVPTSEVLQFKGEMVLNGLFGVEKSNKPIPDGRPSQRLIMDLRASNAILSVIGGDIGTLSGASAFTAIALEEGNVISISGDDLVASFYLFSLPPSWRPFLAFEKPISWRALGYDQDGSTYLSSAVLPMGFSSSVGIMQHIHRRLALWSPRAGAGLNAALEVRRDRPWPDLGDDCPAWCLYLDDSTLLRKVEAQMAETLRGKSQEEQDDLRRAYQFWGIPFNSKKAVEECLSAERLGAYLDGDRGRIGVTAKRTLECLGLSAWVLGQGQVSKKTLQVLAGKEIHCLQFRRPLMSVYDEIWKLIAGPEDYPYLTVKLVNEIVTSMCLSPLRFTDWRAGIDPQVMASDASESGGGFVMASKLSSSGVAQVLKPDERQRTRTGVVVFDFFAGIGGLLRSLERAGLEWEHHVVIESDRHCRRCIRRTWPGASEYTDVQTLTREDMARELDKVENLGLVVAGGGSPCQGLSKLSSQRQHFKDARSKLFFDFAERIEELKPLVAERGAEFVGFMENVVMDESDRDEVTDRLGWKPHLLESGDISRVRRPRLYWMNQTLPQAEWFEIDEFDLVTQVKMKGEIEPDALWVPEGLKFQGDEKLRLPTFTRPIKRPRPPVDPAGLKGSTKEARERWLKDEFRYPPYVYEKKFMLVDSQGNLHKVPAQSREALMGYPVGHTRSSGKLISHRDSGPLVGDCSSPDGLADPEMLLSALVVEYEEFETPGSMAPSSGEEPVGSPSSPLSRLELDEELLQLNCVQDDIDQVALNKQLMTSLVAHFLRRVEYRGSDIRLDSEVLFKPGQCPRTSIDPSKWEWKHCRAFRWRHTAHINLLELKALTHAIQWRARRSKYHSFRTMLLCDSQSVVAVVAKGRSSSKKVNHLLRRLAALCLSLNLYLLICWVDTADNPADKASRIFDGGRQDH
eukprot:Skav227070  [mRNA]  locus=scaffold72:1057412:1062770:- [translate_table: standard]